MATGTDQLTPIADALNRAAQDAKDYADTLVATRPHSRRTGASANTLATGTTTKLSSFGAVDTQVDIGYGSGDWTINTNGAYAVTGQVTFVADSTGIRRAFIYLNGVEVARVSANPLAGGLETSLQVALPTINLVAGDVISLRALQNTGSNLDTDPGLTWMGVSWAHL